MVFTGVAVVVLVTDSICRITGLSLLGGASGTISLENGNPAGQIQIPEAFNASPYDVFDHVVGLDESLHVTIDNLAAGGVGPTPPAVGGANSAMFYGLTAGTGNGGASDYAATVAVQTTAGTGRVPFPRNGASVGTAVARSGVSTNSFIVNVTGLYRISWSISFLEANELKLAINDVLVAESCCLSGAGTQVNTKTIVLALVAGQVLSLVNPAGNAAALTVQTADGTLTHAQAPTLVIESVGGAASVPVAPESHQNPLTIVKTGADIATFVATITNTSADAANNLEIYVKFHT